MYNKPVVHYVGAPYFFLSWTMDEHADVNVVDHPIYGEGNVTTSAVIVKHSDGSFETLNTFYVPMKDGEQHRN